MTRPPEQVAQVRALHRTGLNRSEIARMTEIPRRSVSDWLNGHAPRPSERKVGACFRCGASKGPFSTLFDYSYVYLLGLYLGDGCLQAHPREVFKLNISLDSGYPMIAAECEAAMALVAPRNTANKLYRPHEACVEVYNYSKHWPHLFPQHGAGPKHLRAIELEPWQHDLCEANPGRFLRGLIHSDGCRGLNTIRHPRKTYAYPRYQFSNRSAEIRALFCEYCEMLGVHWTQSNRWTISVARRESVGLLDRHVGPKR